MSSDYALAIIGAGGVGKSAITVQFIQGHFVESYDPTIEDSYRKQISVDESPVMLNVLDTAGQEEYAGMRDVWMSGNEGFMLVYSIIDKNTFGDVNRFNEEILRVKDADEVPRILFGNKSDLEAHREVLTGDGEKLGQSWNSPFFEGSAKVGVNITEAFHQLVREINKYFPDKVKKSGGGGGSGGKRKCMIL